MRALLAPATPIRTQMMKMVLVTSAVVLFLTVVPLFAYEFVTFRQASRDQLNTLGKAIAANSTAALAFDNARDAEGVLAAFEADRHIVVAALYDRDGELFAVYPKAAPADALPLRLGAALPDAQIEQRHLTGYQPVMERGRRLGTLFVKSDLTALDERIRLYAILVTVLIGASAIVAYGVSRALQHRITRPILGLAETATGISTRRDYSLRAAKTNTAEVDQLTEAFNHMLDEIQTSEERLREQLAHLSLLQHITRAIADRQDLTSIFQVVLGSLETNLPIDFACMCRQDAPAEELTVSTLSVMSRYCSDALSLNEGSTVPFSTNGLSRCVGGELIYEADTRAVDLPLSQRFALCGFRSLLVAPLLAERTLYGVLVVARRDRNAFSNGDCEFLKQLSEHVALAAQQSQLNGALQQAYDELRQTQQTVMQQERLRALGQMASGIAHDINNAISPVALYTESLLEREPDLSDRARAYLATIQRAIEDVAGTVARMREFYRPREPQLTLARIDLNRTIQQALELTHARWSDLPQQRGVMIDLQTELSPEAPEVMAAEGEIRDALTNLIFNAVDAMPKGGTLTVRTRVVDVEASHVHIEVSDTGVGMDEEIRRRCLEPFFTTKGERGSGLGLAMVYGMVQRHSAELQIDSEAGRGTTCRLIFPAATQGMVSSTEPQPTPAIAQRLRILLIDDDPMLIKSLEDVLVADGHQVTAAHGGLSGIEAFHAAIAAQQPFAVVITDLGMPHVDGRKVAAAIKAASPATPVIMLTGWGNRLIAENDVPRDVNRMLSKPPRLQELRAALLEVLDARPRREAIPA